MNIGYRIKKLRKELDLTQQKFGERLGVKGNTIAQYELGRSNPVDAVISLMIREFNVNEEWLRTGEGEMFKSTPSNVLEQLVNDYHLSNASAIAIEKFVNLKPEKRTELLNFFLEVSKAIADADLEIDYIPQTPEELEKLYPPIELTDDNKEIS